MGLIYFFDRNIKPIMLKGTQIMNPSPTGVLKGGVSCIKQGDVNLWLYTKGENTIAIDTGHLNEKGVSSDFEKIGINPDNIKHVLITHADVDHCGGIDVKARKNIYPNAEIYLPKDEEQYLKKTIHRMVKLHKKIYNCVQLKNYRLLNDGDIIEIDGISIKCISVPGHTAGHMCYIVDDKILFSGDCLAVNQDGGYAFWDFFCQFPEENKKSLIHLKDIVEKSSVQYVCTGHSGFISDMKNLFAHIDESAPFGRGVVFDETAPKYVSRKKEK